MARMPEARLLICKWHAPRVGFSSLYFKTHASAKMMRGVIETLDRDKFHIVVFALREPNDPPNPHPPKVVRSVMCAATMDWKD